MHAPFSSSKPTNLTLSYTVNHSANAFYAWSIKAPKLFQGSSLLISTLRRAESRASHQKEKHYGRQVDIIEDLISENYTWNERMI